MAKSFAMNAIGFMLQIDDQLTPALASAEKSYGKFVKKLDMWNTKAFKSATRGFSGLARVLDGFTHAPAQLASVYTRAIRSLNKASNKSSLRLNVDFSKGAQKSLSVTISRAVAGALRKGTFGVGGRGGQITIPRFAKGGLVGGKTSTGPPKDNIQALLSEGERIIGNKDYPILEEQIGQVRDASGKFVKGLPGELSKASKAFDGFTKSLENLAQIQEAGLDPSAPAKYAAQLVKLKAVQALFFAQIKAGSNDLKSKLVPRLLAMNAQIKALKGNTTNAAGPLEKLLTKVLGPARFLAINAALENVQENFFNLKSAGQDVARALDISGDAGGLVTNLQEANKVLGLSAEGLRALRHRLLAASATLPLSVGGVDKLTEAFGALVDAGAGQEAAEGLMNTVGLMERATGMATASAAGLATVLNNDLKFSVESTKGVMASWAAQQAALDINMSEFAGTMEEVARSNSRFFDSLGPEQAAKALSSIGSLVAGATKLSVTAGSEVAEMFNNLADPEKFAAVSSTLGLVGADLGQALAAGGPQALLQGFQNMDPTTIDRVAASLGMGADAVRVFTTQAAELRTAVTSASDASMNLGDSQEYLTKRITGSQTTFQALKEGAGALVQRNLPDLLQLMSDLNPVLLLSIAYLGLQTAAFFGLGPAAASASAATVAMTAATAAMTGATVPATAAVTGLGVATGIALGPLIAIGAAIAIAVGLVIYFRKEIASFLSGAWSGFMSALEPLWEEVKPAFEVLGEYVSEFFGMFATGADSSADSLETWAYWGDVIGRTLGDLLHLVISPLIVGVKLLAAAFTFLVNVWSDPGAAFDSLLSSLSGIWKYLTDLPGLGAGFKLLGDGVMTYLVNPIMAALDALGKLTAMLTDDVTFSEAGQAYQDKGKRMLATRSYIDKPAPALSNGGIVVGGRGGGVDDVLAMLSKGEIVVPPATSARLSEMATNPITSYPMLGQAQIDAVSSNRLPGDNRVVDLLSTMLGVMKDQLGVAKSGTSVNVTAPATRGGGSSLSRGVAEGNY